jgi:hypothetical protein
MSQTRHIIVLRADLYADLQSHLLPRKMVAEEAAFLFARVTRPDDALRFEVIDWYAVPPEGFVTRSLYYLELTDETRAHVIKKAHDLGSALIEAHSHAGSYPAEFSPSDKSGFADFVPHVLWRLKSRPYAAIVMARNSIDALAWIEASQPLPIAEVCLESGASVTPTGLSLANYYSDVYFE